MGNFSMLALRIKELRASLGMTQKDFAAYVGCTAATLSAYENDSKSPSLEIIKTIAEKCHVSIDWLCGLSEKKSCNTEIKTYADMLRIIINLCDINIRFDKWKAIYEDNSHIIDMSRTGINSALLRIYDDETVSFFKDWVQMYKLYESRTIDKHLYELWISDKMKQYENMLLDVIDEELPFNQNKNTE